MNTIYTIESRAEGADTSRIPPSRARIGTAKQIGRLATLLLAWMLALLWPFAAGAQSYTAALIQPGVDFHAQGLTDAAEVLGQYYPDGVARPVVSRDGVLFELPLLPGTMGGIARAGNKVGQIVGACFDELGYRACMWQNGSVTALPTRPGMFQAEAIDINDAGGVVGVAMVEAGVYEDGSIYYQQEAVIWQGENVHTIPAPYADQQTYANAIDASGRLAVSVYDNLSGALMPARWTPDVPNGSTGTIELLDEWGGYAYDINDAGIVCGYDYAWQATVWNGSTPTVLGVLPGYTLALATGINEAGAVVGYNTGYWEDGFNYDTVYAAFIATPEHAMRDLNALLNETSPDVGRLNEAFAVNNAGQILALAEAGYVLLTPSTLPPPLPAPKNLSAHPGNNRVSLSWYAVGIAHGYNVKRSTVSGGPYTTIATGVNGTDYVDQTAVNGTRYYYVVTALADTRESANSNEATTKPLAPPVAPTGLMAKIAKAKVQLTWTQSTSPEVVSNRVYRSTNGGAYVLVANIPAGLTWTDNSARSRTDYRYVVTAVNSIWLESPASNAVSARPK